ncbi:hypothetical protein MKW98_021216 [Papaver atlanticum]|uniref:DRBM domain-containing protein n=1 Tax=Papaver atlanticum TaxID=357466 RepID=A0AAD4S910_9MAGN|nr:hypothetical protein MKW98_021216 [Papaver atlanticum]
MEFMTKLQEICDHDLWGYPNYTSIRDGPGRFKASVLVCGKTFHAPDFCTTSQEAQNEAAKLAYHHFSTASSKKPLNRPAKIRRIDSPSPPISNSSPAAGLAILQHKNQLQIYAQKRKLNLPTYFYVREGPPHNVRCKAMVTVDGQTFESPEFCRTQKEAEHAASRVALESLMRAGILEARNSIHYCCNLLLIWFFDESAGFSKNFLQEFLMKEGLPLPAYNTKSCGAPHLPTFLCTVQVGTDAFEGMASRTKKQAEMNAAKVAYCHLKESTSSKSSGSMISQAKDALRCTSSNSSLNLDLQLSAKSEDLLATPPAQESRKEWKGSYKDANLAKPVEGGKFSSPPSVASPFKPGVTSIMRNRVPGATDARPQVPLPFSLSSTGVCVNCSLSPIHQGRCARHSPCSHAQLTPYKRRFEAREQVNNNRFKSKGGV